MDNTNVSLLLEKMKEKEERDALYNKIIKDGEAEIKSIEEEVQQLQHQKLKLKEDNNKKLLEFSRTTIDYELLLKQKEIWTEIYENTCSELKEKKGELDALQQSIFTNRISFCDDINDFVDDHGLLQMSRGIFKPIPSALIKPVVVKTEQEDEEYNSLQDTVKRLEKELEELNKEEAEVDNLKKYKAQLEAEPTYGENFIRLRNTLKDMKDNLQKAEEETKKVKSDIAQMELKILRKKNEKEEEFKILNSQVPKREHEKANISQKQKFKQKMNDLKAVKFNETVETRKIESSPKLKGILKTTKFKVKSPSPSWRKSMSQQRMTKLDQEMNSILFGSKSSTETSTNKP